MKRTKLILILFLLPISLFAQNTINGKVINEQNQPLPGASVLVKGTSNGQVTDFDGAFTLSLNSTPATLVVSYLGYTTQELIISNQSTITVLLKEDQEQLDEVVVVGYGSVNKKDLTGSVVSIKPTEDIVEQSRGVEDILRGRSAGVQVSANSPEPGGSVSVKIRGLSSLSGNSEPLYVIDGIIMDSATEDVENPISGYTPPQGGGISGLNPADIQSIEVLKDASATAIYGSRAANGVIIVTTKKGKIGKAKFNLISSISTGSVVRNINVLDTEGYARYQNDMREVLGQDIPYTINADGSIFTTASEPEQIKGVNWSEDTYRNSIVKRHRLSISGGGEEGDYYFSGGFISNQGTFPNALAESTDFNFKLNQNLSEKIKISAKIAATYNELTASKGPDENGGANNSMVRQVILAAPILNFSENSDLDDPDENLDGPRAWTTDYDDDAEEIRLLGTLNLDYKLSDIFTYRIRFGSDYRKKDRSFWYGVGLRKGNDPNGLAGVSSLSRFRYNLDNTLMFRKRFNRNHRINGTVGVLLDKRSIKTSRYSASDFADKSLRADGISFGGAFTPLVIGSEDGTIVSFIGRLNYTLANKYLFTGTIRADGSSNFPSGNQWGYFPAASFAWKVNEEAFLKDSNTISDLKIRLGYGEVGNQNIPAYRYLSIFDKTEALLADATGGNLIPVVPQFLSNPDLIWETSSQYNAGLDFGLFDNRFTGTVEAYHKSSSDLLLNVSIPPSTGFATLIANQGDIENRGIEISLRGDIIRNKKINWNIFGNVSINKNEITDLRGIDSSNQFGNLGEVVGYLGTQIAGGTYFKQPANIFIVGREAGLFFGLETDGIIRTDEQLTNTATGDPLKYKGTDMRLGDVLFVDQNGDGDITDADKTIIGNPNPDFSFGFGTSFEYRNFSISALFNGVYGNDIANGNLLETAYANNSTRNVRTAAYVDAFHTENNPNGAYPSVGVGGIGTDYTREFNDRAVEDGSFLRLSNVTLGFNVPVDQIDFIDSMKLSLTGQNLWLLTDYTGFDPEVDSFAYDPTRLGIDWGTFPNQRTFTFSINVTF